MSDWESGFSLTQCQRYEFHFIQLNKDPFLEYRIKRGTEKEGQISVPSSVWYLELMNACIQAAIKPTLSSMHAGKDPYHHFQLAMTLNPILMDTELASVTHTFSHLPAGWQQCNILDTKLSALRKCQLIQNVAMHLLSNINYWEYIKPVLHLLHKLPIE